MAHPRPSAKWASLALLLVFCSPTKPPAQGGATPEWALQNAKRVVMEGDAVVNELAGWLFSMGEIRRQQNPAAADAMLALGQLRPPEAIPALRKHALFSRHTWRQSVHDFTAIAALARIGLPAMQALIDIAAEGYEGEALAYPLAPLLAAMHSPHIIARLLEEAALGEPDPARRRNLTLTAADVRRSPSSQDLWAVRTSGVHLARQAPAILEEAERVLEERQAVVQRLTAWLLSMDTIPPEQAASALEAMGILGEFRAPEAVEALRRHALFVSTDPATAPEDFVALSALAKIGLPAVPALIDIAAEGREGEGLDYPLVGILASMVPPQVMADYLEQVAEDEIDPDRYARLKKIAEGLRAEADKRQ